MPDIIVTSEMCNGLRESTAEDLAMFDECMSSAVPFTFHWEDRDNSAKVFQWDDEWKRYVKHLADLIDDEGREVYLPWNIFEELQLSFLDGYATTQGSGDCLSFGHGNATQTTMLTIGKRTGRVPIEIAYSMTYAIARGNGRPDFGSGLNLNPMSKWSSTVGNYWTSDFGRYDTGSYVRKYQKGSHQDINALRTQTIPVYLPRPDFNLCYDACAAGFGITMGTDFFPSASMLNSDGLGVPSSYSRGGHSMSWTAAWKAASSKRYLFLKNSHGPRYVADSLSKGKKQFGCWVDEANFRRIVANNVFRFGTWYVALCELPRLNRLGA
ncbi:MAG: hypothetical protein FWD31_02120 [Planctomycetaceae bacterium]|nr:hypothetical protein [Planctomycetaceae bacterium]